jgi:hypothetical protein
MADSDKEPTITEAKEAAKLALLKRIKVAAEDRSSQGPSARDFAEAYAWLQVPGQNHGG